MPAAACCSLPAGAEASVLLFHQPDQLYVQSVGWRVGACGVGVRAGRGAVLGAVGAGIAGCSWEEDGAVRCRTNAPGAAAAVWPCAEWGRFL